MRGFFFGRGGSWRLLVAPGGFVVSWLLGFLAFGFLLRFLALLMSQESLVWMFLSAARITEVSDTSLELVMQMKLYKHYRSKYFEDIVAHMVARGIEEQYRDIAEQHGVGYGTVVKPSSILDTLRMFAAQVSASCLGKGDPPFDEMLASWLLGFLASWLLGFLAHQSIYQSIHLSIFLSIYPSIYLICQSIYLSFHLSIHPSIYPSIYLSSYLSIYQSI